MNAKEQCMPDVVDSNSKDRKLFDEKLVSEWQEYVDWVDSTTPSPGQTQTSVIFRGQKHYDSDPLKTSLHRAIDSARPLLEECRDIEKRLIAEFRRRLHHYSVNIPHALDYLELLSMMQHYGAPTRLLDWTFSPYVALFFAIEHASGNDCSEVWSKTLTDLDVCEACKKLRLEDDFMESFKAKCREDYGSQIDAPPQKLATIALVYHLIKSPTPCIVGVNPYRLNDRLAVQQGTFLMVGDPGVTVLDNMKATQNLGQWTRVTIEMSPDSRKKALTYLHRMNINRATLFPGLAGFAESLRIRIAIPHALSRG